MIATESELRFLTYIMRPWQELNSLLARRLAFQPEISDVIRMAGNLAVAIKHHAENVGVDPEAVHSESIDNQIISDVADVWKHRTLRKPSRQNSLSVESLFECNSQNQFRFVHNIVEISHTSCGNRDFLITSRDAIIYWAHKMKTRTLQIPAIAEGPEEFYATAFLAFDGRYQVSMSTTKIRFVRRSTTGDLEAFDPPLFDFEIYETNSKLPLPVNGDGVNSPTQTE